MPIERVRKLLERVTYVIALVGCGALLLFAALTFYDGGARYLNLPRVAGFSDYGQLIFPIVIAACFPAGLLQRSHLSIRLAGKILGVRANAWLNTFAAVVVAAFFAAMAWQLIVMTRDFAAAGRTTTTIELPLAPWWAVASALIALCVPIQLFVVLDCLRNLGERVTSTVASDP